MIGDIIVLTTQIDSHHMNPYTTDLFLNGKGKAVRSSLSKLMSNFRDNFLDKVIAGRTHGGVAGREDFCLTRECLEFLDRSPTSVGADFLFDNRVLSIFFTCSQILDSAQLQKKLDLKLILI